MQERNCETYLEKRAQVLNEFDNFCEQFERRAAESFINPERHNDDKFKLFDDGSETGDTTPTID